MVFHCTLNSQLQFALLQDLPWFLQGLLAQPCNYRILKTGQVRYKPDLPNPEVTIFIFSDSATIFWKIQITQRKKAEWF